MRFFNLNFLLIFASFELIHGKEFEQCEFVRELYEKHKVPREEIYKHLCIVSTLLTSHDNFGHLGIYGIGSTWWCGQNAPGGSCNVTCGNLLDDDIADDVACANLIMAQQGVEAFGETMGRCKHRFESHTEECIAEEEIYESLQNVTFTTSTTPKPVTTTTSITIPLTTTTRRATTRKSTTSTQRTTTTERTTRQPPKTTEKTAQLQNSEDEEKSDAIVWVVAVILVAILIILLVVKFKPVMKNRISHERRREFENTMSNL